MAFFLKLDLALNICRAAGYSGVINGFRGPEQFFGSRKFDHVGCLDATRVQSRRRGLDRSSPTERNSDKATSTGAFGFLLLFSCSFHFSFFFVSSFFIRFVSLVRLGWCLALIIRPVGSPPQNEFRLWAHHRGFLFGFSSHRRNKDRPPSSRCNFSGSAVAFWFRCRAQLRDS